MALIYSSICSLDGYVADRDGRFDWAAPDEEVHAAANERQRRLSTYLFGRRMYEVMAAWDTMGTDDDPAVIRDFADTWRQIDKVVFSATLPAVSTQRTRLERTFNAADVRRLVEDAQGDVSIGGPTLAASAWRGGLVDELELYVVPVVVGAGTRALPADIRLDLQLLDQRRFAGGTVGLRYRVRP